MTGRYTPPKARHTPDARRLVRPKKNRSSDTRIVYGARCLWWDSIDKAHTLIGSALPCCPHCTSPLFEVSSEAEWWQGVARHEAGGNEGYEAFVRWLRGKCYASMDDARAAYEAGQ